MTSTLPQTPVDLDPPTPLEHARRGLRHRFHRSRRHRMLGGVCAGLADDLDIDPNLVRIVAVVGAVASLGLAVAGYVAAWALLPERD